MTRLISKTLWVNIEAQSQRIADFLRRQDHLVHLLAVWHGGREIVYQALPDVETAFGALRESLGLQQPASGLRQASLSSARLRRLESRIDTCIHGLMEMGTESIICVKIGNQDARSEMSFKAAYDGTPGLNALLASTRWLGRKAARIVANGR
jgi:hypothetical protein